MSWELEDSAKKERFGDEGFQKRGELQILEFEI